ncbi:MAG: hypothetical protein AB1696_25015 [Planctomycetota bacterium]
MISARKGLDFTGEGESLRQRALRRGVIGFRLSPPAVAALSREWTQAKILAAIKDLLRTDPAWKRHAKAPLIRVKESLNKDALKDLDLCAADLARGYSGVFRGQVFRYSGDISRGIPGYSGDISRIPGTYH